MYEPTAKLQHIPRWRLCWWMFPVRVCVCVCVCNKAKSAAFQRETIASLPLTHQVWRNSSTRPHTTCSPSFPPISLTRTTCWIGLYLLYVVCKFACEGMRPFKNATSLVNYLSHGGRVVRIIVSYCVVHSTLALKTHFLNLQTMFCQSIHRKCREQMLYF